MKKKRKLAFPNRIPEPKEMEKLEFDVFEGLSSRNYKRWFMPLVDSVLRQNPPRDARILDVACGPGLLAKALGEKSLKFSIVGIDPSLYALRLARKNCKGLPNVSFKKGTVEELLFKDESFDVVVCKDSLHHFDDIHAAMKEMVRVLKPEGLLYFQDMRRDLPKYLLQRATPPDSSLKKLQFYSIRASYTKEEMKKILKRAGVKKYIVRTQKATASMKDYYKKKFHVDPQELKVGFQARYYVMARK